MIMDKSLFYEWTLSLQCAWLAIHFVGLASVWMVRMQAGMKAEGLAQLMFLTSFCAVFLTTVVGLGLGTFNWTFSAGTLAIMIVVAVADFSPARSPSIQIELAASRKFHD